MATASAATATVSHGPVATKFEVVPKEGLNSREYSKTEIIVKCHGVAAGDILKATCDHGCVWNGHLNGDADEFVTLICINGDKHIRLCCDWEAIWVSIYPGDGSNPSGNIPKEKKFTSILVRSY